MTISKQDLEQLLITDLTPCGENGYWWTALPTNDDKEKPYIRTVKVGSTRYLAFFDSESGVWAYVTMTNV